MIEGFAIFYLIAVLFAIVLAVCWIVLPFALIGTKPILRQILAETQKTNALLAQRLPDLASRNIRPSTES